MINKKVRSFVLENNSCKKSYSSYKYMQIIIEWISIYLFS